jgi:hypothetical protein
MSLTDLVELAKDNLIVTIVIGLLMLFIIFRLNKAIHIHLGAKKYVRKSKKLRGKKYNGVRLGVLIKSKRKNGTNSYKKLRGRAKRMVKKYFNYKLEELPIITKYSYGKLYKVSHDRLIIFAKNKKRIVKKVRIKKGLNDLIDFTNKYECLDEMVLFLHNLPEAILEKQNYDVYVSEQDISIGYKIK